VRLAPVAVVQEDGHDDNDDYDDFDPNDLDQLPEADDEDTHWDDDDDDAFDPNDLDQLSEADDENTDSEEEETAGPTRATRAESGEVLDQYAPDRLPSVDPNRVDSHLSSNENCF